MSLTSHLGEGSEFSFWVVMGRYTDEVESKAVENTAPMTQRYDGYQLLVVEDNEINQEIAKATLREMGFLVDLASNGKEGIAAFEAKEYALIFMDIRMPLVDGLEATRAIRALEEEYAAGGEARERVPIIAMTANAMEDDRKASREAGMDGHVSKPLDLAEIRRILYKTLISK